MADFAVELLKLTPLEQCMVMSPLSLVAALAVLERGAGGVTKDQIVNALKRKSDSDVSGLIRQLNAADGVLMAVATKFYLAHATTIHEEYNSTVSKDFDVTAERLDFSKKSLTVETINKFVSDATRKMLPKLLSDDFYEPDTRAMLVNAVYFKGMWANQFSKDSTRKDVFHGIGGDREESFMVKFQMKQCRYGVAEGAQVLTMPYKDHNYQFVIFLPLESVPFKQFREEFSGDKLREILNCADEARSGVNVTIPKFKIESTPDMKNMLQALGIKELFSDRCDLQGVSPDQLYVSDVIHKAVVEVSEEGTEAAAATAAVMMVRCMPIVHDFIADCPFVYGIFREDEPLFIGQFC